MRVTYNSHIIKIRDVTMGNGEVDAKIREVSPNIVRLKGKDGETIEVGKWVSEKEHTPKFAVTEVELIKRDPTKRSYISDSDTNRLYWGHEKGEGTVVRNHTRGCPMFFRENGAAIDLIDSQRGACFLVLNGPSLESINTNMLTLPGIVSFGVNNGAHNIRPNYWTCVDDPKRFLHTIWRDQKITKFVPMHHFAKPIWDLSGRAGLPVRDFPSVFGYRRNEKFDASRFLIEDTINWGNHGNFGGGRSCMLVALRIIHLLGFRKVFLLGCDFHMSESQKYFFKEERTAGAIRGNNSSYKILSGYFKSLLPVFNDDGFEVLNCNPNSNLDVFPFADYYEAIASHSIDISCDTNGMYVDKDDNRRKDRNPIL